MACDSGPMRTRHRPPLDQVGTDPDYRFSLANERTFLAWVRTSLALVAGGVAVIHLLPDRGQDLEAYLIGVPLVGLGAALPLISLRRWDENERAMRLSLPLPRTVILHVLAWWVAITAIVAGVVFAIEVTVD
jgi:putative membrane protein